jgi:hypothetical protein
VAVGLIAVVVVVVVVVIVSIGHTCTSYIPME